MKRVIAGLALALAVGAYAAHPQTLNKEGFVGVNKTQSGQSLGHSKLAFFALLDYADGFKNLNGATVAETENTEISKFMGLNANVGFALGIWHYFDIGVALPVCSSKLQENLRTIQSSSIFVIIFVVAGFRAAGDSIVRTRRHDRNDIAGARSCTARKQRT